MTDLDHLMELRAKATPGPWMTRRVETPGDGPDSFAELIDTEARAVMRHPAHGARGANWAPEEADAALIVAAVNALPDLVRELKEARAAIAQARRGAFEEAAAAVRGANGISEDQNWHYEMAARHIEALAVND